MNTINLRQAARALGGDAYGANRILCPGPGHGRNDRSLAVTLTDSGFLVHSFAGDDFKECRDHVKAVLGLSDDNPPLSTPAPFVDPDRMRKQKTAVEIWERSTPIAGTLAEAYLASRGIIYSCDALRFYPGGRAMVALITNALTGEPQGVHRTFLDRDGKKIDRKMLGIAAGGVVRLSASEEVTSGLGVAEGIETALASPYRPVWACLSAGTLRTFPVLPGIGALTIIADHDRAGIDAANECGQRWHSAGCEVTITLPTAAGADFADLVEEAA